MRIKDLMSSDVEVIRPKATVAEAAEMMKTLDLGVLPISNGGRRPAAQRSVSAKKAAQTRLKKRA